MEREYTEISTIHWGNFSVSHKKETDSQGAVTTSWEIKSHWNEEAASLPGTSDVKELIAALTEILKEGK